ncbi:GIY-YIG nuclease family protein [Proteus mirabilis]|uniref:GIY-YIG nuclease family protein n=1 Tax=Proteus mirabilis TaxID=584 RepID=UPI0029DFB570|nr:GIY-YIG nuclease family protein [Proteus mirabilis]WSE88862.1 GIY-YIG nuclease family protein [Proteus mirabilis]HEK1958008.1 GIY-YIG nuclease family protein [Proteus mirabilis]
MSVGHLGEMKFNREVSKTESLPTNFRVEGWVYILSNEYMPGIYKVGMTTISPENRAKELSSATGVPDKFKVEASFYSEFPSNDESTVHDYLDKYRINESREFFKCDLEEIIETCEEVCIARVGDKVEVLADSYDIICTESLDKLHLGELFDSLNVSVFGCKVATAERLIRLAVHLCSKRFNTSHALYFKEDTAYLVQSVIGQNLEEWKKHNPELANRSEVPF